MVNSVVIKLSSSELLGLQNKTSPITLSQISKWMPCTAMHKYIFLSLLYYSNCYFENHYIVVIILNCFHKGAHKSSNAPY